MPDHSALGKTAEEVARIEAARDELRKHGIDISLPWEGDLDDLERDHYEGLVAAIRSSQPQWQPMSEAPHTTHELLCRWPNGDIQYHFCLDGIAYHDGEEMKDQPSWYFDPTDLPPPQEPRNG